MVSGFDKRGTNYENVWEHGNIGQYWKGTREQGPPLGDPPKCENVLLLDRKSSDTERFATDHIPSMQ